MNDRKLTGGEAEAYWSKTHRQTSSDLRAVCFPNESLGLNAFFDRIQKYAVGRALDELQIGGPDARVLEVGCGRGRWLRFLRGRGAAGIGIDLSPEAVGRCVDEGLAAVVGSATELPFTTGSFDLVASITVLLHLPGDSQERAAAEMQRVCRAGGHVLLLEGSSRDSAPHVWSRPAREWMGLFGECRPVYIESHYFGFPLRLLWKLPIGRAPRSLRATLEAMALRVAWPVELALMRTSHRHRRRGGLQTLIVLRKTLVTPRDGRLQADDA